MKSLMKNNFLYNIIIIQLLLTVTSFGQYSKELDQNSLLYPKANSISLNETFEININLYQDEISITQDQHIETLYLNETAKHQSKEAISYSYFYEISEIEAHVHNFDGKKYKSKKVKDFKTKDNLSGSFHDDIKSISFIYPNLEKGAKSSLQYRTTIKNPRFLNTIFLGDYNPIAQKKVTIYVDKSIDLEFQKFNLDSIDYNFNKSENKKQNIYTWEIKNVKAFEYNPEIMSYRSEVPHIIPIIQQYKTSNNETIDVLSSEKSLYNWYYSLVKDLNNDDYSSDLKPLVDSLISNCKTDKEKVKAIYYWTQQNIKYIAFEDGLGGFIPRKANDVYEKKYGDCKDNSSILEAMLKLANLNGHITWVGTRKLPYKYKEVPTPIVDNHMILTYFDIDSSIYFLDATGRYLDLDLPSSFIQGKETLIAIDSINYIIQKVPEVPAEKNKTTDSCTFEIIDNQITGKGKTSYTGYSKSSLFSILEGIQKTEDLNTFYKREVEKGNNKFSIIDFKEHNKFRYDIPFSVDYNFKIPNYINKDTKNIYLNLNLNPYLKYFKPEKEHKGAIEYKYKTIREDFFRFKIPDGYKVDFMPEDLNITNDLYSCSIKYKQNNNIIEYQQNISLNFLKLNASQVTEYNQFIREVEKSYKESIVLSKN